MAFSRDPIWDRKKNFVGVRILFSDSVASSSGAQAHSLWSALASASACCSHKPPGSLFIWSLSPRLWRQALDLASCSRESFTQWCRHIREHGIQLATPSLNDIARELPEAIDLASALRGQSVSLHLDGMPLDKLSISLASHCVGSILDASSEPNLCGELARKLAAAGKSSIISNAGCPSAFFDIADGAAGPFLGSRLWDRPLAPKASKIHPSSQKALLALSLALSESTASDIDEVLQSDPVLAYKLISLVNSPGLSPLRHRVGTVKQALLVLGRARLAQWLATLALRSPQRNSDASALRWVLCARAKLCETLAAKSHDPSLAPEAFVCGIFSGLDVLFGCHRSSLLLSCPLPPSLEAALDASSSRLGAILALSMAAESCDRRNPQTQELAERAGIPLSEIEPAQLQALQWALRFA